MAAITTRAGKGAPLTHAEVDANFNNLNNDKLDIGSAPANSITVASSGRVGIGTSSPQARLEVQAPGTSRSYTSSVLDFSNIHLNGITPSAATSALTFTSGGGGGAAVAFSRGGSFDTEISFWTNSALAASAATQRMIIDAAGRVGIGTSSPLVPLHVNGSNTTQVGFSGTTKGIRFDFDGTQSTIFGVDNTFFGSYQPLRIGGSYTAFTSGGSEVARIDPSGNVLIGTSASRGGRSEFVSGTANTNADFSGAAASFVGAGSIGIGSIRATISVEDNSEMAINVGGAIGFGGRYVTASTQYAQWAAVAGKKETGISGEYGGYLGFYTRTHNTNAIDERMRIDSSGRLLVGTSTAVSNNVHCIYNSSGDTTLLITKDNSSATALVSAVYHTATTGNNTFFNFYTEASPTLRGGIDYNRSAGQVRYNVTSDRRLKSEIQPANTALDTLAAIQVRSYKWAETGYQVEYGFIAQELNEVAPDAVKEGDDGDVVTDAWAVDNGKLVPLLAKALQEAIAKIETLEAKVAALEAG